MRAPMNMVFGVSISSRGKRRCHQGIEYLSAIDEAEYVIAQASAPVDNKGRFITDMVDVRHRNEFTKTAAENVNFMDVSPKQVVSVAASLIRSLSMMTLTAP